MGQFFSKNGQFIEIRSCEQFRHKIAAFGSTYRQSLSNLLARILTNLKIDPGSSPYDVERARRPLPAAGEEPHRQNSR